jgi:prepilin-type N-terminal cleavage/methylation domain-containing protein
VKKNTHKFLTGSDGFTFIEVSIVIAIFALFAALGLPLVSNMYEDFMLISERDQLLSVLRKTRSTSIINKNSSDHGLYVASTSFTIFEGLTYATRNQAEDEVFSSFDSVTIIGPQEVVFQAFSGRTPSTSFSLSNNTKTIKVFINEEGNIDW